MRRSFPARVSLSQCSRYRGLTRHRLDTNHVNYCPGYLFYFAESLIAECRMPSLRRRDRRSTERADALGSPGLVCANYPSVCTSGCTSSTATAGQEAYGTATIMVAAAQSRDFSLKAARERTSGSTFRVRLRTSSPLLVSKCFSR